MKRSRRSKQQPAKQAPPVQHFIREITDFHPPVPVLPGDQLETEWTPSGPLFHKIIRNGVQIWPPLKDD